MSKVKAYDEGWLNYCNQCGKLYFVKASDVQRVPIPKYEDQEFKTLHNCPIPKRVVPVVSENGIETKVAPKYLSEGAKVLANVEGEKIKAVINRIFANGSVTLIVEGKKGVVRVHKKDIQLI